MPCVSLYGSFRSHHTPSKDPRGILQSPLKNSFTDEPCQGNSSRGKIRKIYFGTGQANLHPSGPRKSIIFEECCTCTLPFAVQATCEVLSHHGPPLTPQISRRYNTYSSRSFFTIRSVHKRVFSRRKKNGKRGKKKWRFQVTG